MRIPKTPTTNLQWRINLFRRAEKDEGLREDLLTAASLSVLFFVNAFCFTYRKFVTDESGVVRQALKSGDIHVPFVTWEVQDRHILMIEDAIQIGYDLLTDKSRDMGASWDHIVAIHHQWLFKSDRNFLEISRKEDCVDQYGKEGETGSDPGTLFGKHDYINRWLPPWLLPQGSYSRKRMHLVNLRNGSRIDGESSNATAGSSDRRTAILLDEMAKMAEGEGIKRSTKDVTACRLVNSTPNGPGTAFSKWRQSGQVKVFPLMYWDHPEKGRGRHVVPNETYSHLGPWLVRCPWFDRQEEERSPKEIAIEILADHIGSGDTYFEAQNIELHRKLFAKPPMSRWAVDFKKGLATDAIPTIIARSQIKNVNATRSHKGPLRVWARLIQGRLDQTLNYIITADISKGQGASNSVLDVFCVETREKVAEWADANTPPYDLARISCALALWVGGARKNGRPLQVWEANGPGWDYGRQIVKTYKYPFYFCDRTVGAEREKRGNKYGWHSTGEKKELALGLLRRAYAHGGFINHSEEALDEALTYVYYAGGGIGPATLAEESSAARKTHGDRVVADMLCLVALEDAPKPRHEGPKAPANSPAGRLAARQRERKRQATGVFRDTFDYRRTSSAY